MLLSFPPVVPVMANEKNFSQVDAAPSVSPGREQLQCILNSLQMTHASVAVAAQPSPKTNTIVNAKALTFNDVPAECINYASAQYRVPPLLILSMLKTENGHIGLAKRNNNGSIDYGPAQINSRWLATLKPYGIDRQSLQYDPCVNVDVGTWILAQELAKTPNYSEAVGNYNSHTPIYNHRYAFKVLHWQKYLQQGLAG